MNERKQQLDPVTYEQAAHILGIRPRTLQKRVKEEQLTRYHHPADRRIYLLDRNEVEALLDFEIVLPRKQAA